ncbi:hypothetical protein GWI33_012166, partial [Rhynchophorus ferrugineus]
FEHELIALGQALDWQHLENSFEKFYCLNNGAPAKPIRLMSGLLMLKQLYNLSDESVVKQWQMNPYFQIFCGNFFISTRLHGKHAEEPTVIVDSTVQEKAITYPTDAKLAIRIINRLNKLAKANQIQQRRTYIKEVKTLRHTCRNFNHPRRRKAARKALKRLRTIAHTLRRELKRKLPSAVLETQQDNFELYVKVLNQQPKDKNKIYSLHEPQVYCVGKGKEHLPYEYGAKASIVTTLNSGIIVGYASHTVREHDSKCLVAALENAHLNRTTQISTAVLDRGYKGCKSKVDIEVILPSPPLKRDSKAQQQRKRILCRRRSAIEPVIGHLKHQYRLHRNHLKGHRGDVFNLAMAACAWNLKKWLNAFLLSIFYLLYGTFYALFDHKLNPSA